MTDNVCIHEKEIAALAEQNKAIFKRIDEHSSLTRCVYELTAELKVMNTELKSMRQDISDLKNDVDGIKMKPRKQMDDFVKALLSALAGSVVAFIMLRLGLT